MNRVELIENFTKDFELEYENFIFKHDNSMMYHSVKYFNFLKGLIGARPLCIVSREDGRIVGVLPIMYVDGNLGKVYNSLPYYGSNGSVLSDSKATTMLLLKFYNQLSNSPNVASSTIISNPFDNTDWSDEIEFNHKDYRIGQFTDIAFHENHREQLMKKIHYKTRNVIRKALKYNVKVIVDNSQLKLLYKLHKENMKSIGGLAKDVKIIDQIKKNYLENKDYKVFIAEYENKVVAGLLVFYFKNTVEYYMPVINSEFRNLQALSLLIFEAMSQASILGYKTWNWGGTWESQKGVYSFKKRWGTKNEKYFYLTKVNNTDLYNLDENTLSREYQNFFVLPFKNLIKNE
jgi:hypothetical protein